MSVAAQMQKSNKASDYVYVKYSFRDIFKRQKVKQNTLIWRLKEIGHKQKRQITEQNQKLLSR